MKRKLIIAACLAILIAAGCSYFSRPPAELPPEIIEQMEFYRQAAKDNPAE